MDLAEKYVFRLLTKGAAIGRYLYPSRGIMDAYRPYVCPRADCCRMFFQVTTCLGPASTVPIMPSWEVETSSPAGEVRLGRYYQVSGRGANEEGKASEFLAYFKHGIWL